MADHEHILHEHEGHVKNKNCLSSMSNLTVALLIAIPIVALTTTTGVMTYLYLNSTHVEEKGNNSKFSVQ